MVIILIFDLFRKLERFFWRAWMASKALWILAGVTAATGAAYFYLRNKNQARNQTITEVLETQGTSNSKMMKKDGLIAGTIKKITRERKMIFVVNRPLLSNKQILFVTVSTACLRYYRSIMNNREYYNENVKPWTRTGQMKVVLKANTGDELQSILDRCRHENIEALILNIGDLFPNKDMLMEEKSKGKKKNDNLPTLANQDPKTPVILCVLAPTSKLDIITGHLKLL